MTPENTTVSHDEDLDRADVLDKWRLVAGGVVILLLVSVVWLVMAQNKTANTTAGILKAQSAADKNRASSEASQKYTLAQQVAAACAISGNEDDLGGLCTSAKDIVREGPSGSPGIQGPPGATGPQGPLGPKGEQGVQGNQGILGKQGIFGKVGDTGVAGPSGPTGTLGEPGTDGSPGTDGTDGVDGKDGTDGTDGSRGPAGPVAFPFTFTFNPPLPATETYTCTITTSDAAATCVTSTPGATP